jgi:hypothetical protein
MQMHVDIYLSNDETHVPWRIRLRFNPHSLDQNVST